MSGQWLVLALVTCGPVVVGFVLLWRKVERRAARERWPFDELSIRPAGESTRLAAAAWNEKFQNWAMLAVGLPVAMLLVSSKATTPALSV